MRTAELHEAFCAVARVVATPDAHAAPAQAVVGASPELKGWSAREATHMPWLRELQLSLGYYAARRLLCAEATARQRQPSPCEISVITRIVIHCNQNSRV